MKKILCALLIALGFTSCGSPDYVWVVSYNQPDFQDCNAVCSTKEKAIASVIADFDRCSDRWTNIVKEYETENWIIYSFDFVGEGSETPRNLSVSVYKTQVE